MTIENFKDVDWLLLRVAKRIEQLAGGLDIGLLKFGLQEFLVACDDMGPENSYKYFSAHARRCASRMAGSVGSGGIRMVLYLGLLQAINNTLQSPDFLVLPERVKRNQQKHYLRILDGVAPDVDWMNFESDWFWKDFGLASMRLFAGGSQLIHPFSGIPRSIVFSGGVSGVLPAFRSIVKLGGFSPYFELHTHSAYLEEFNENGRLECFHCCAELLDYYPDVRGVIAGSWFYDPQIETISPRLAYLARVPLGAGAERIFMASDGDFVGDAILTSPTRRRLYDDGVYHPRSYLLVWRKNRLKEWAASNPLCE